MVTGGGAVCAKAATVKSARRERIRGIYAEKPETSRGFRFLLTNRGEMAINDVSDYVSGKKVSICVSR
jgi:hypothetical protein